MKVLHISDYLLDKKVRAMRPDQRARHYYWTRTNIRALRQDEAAWLAKYERGKK